MKIKFTKMQGLGNDFVVLNAIQYPELATLSLAAAQFLSDRHFGVGCDQILLVEPSSTAGVDFRYRIFNADGGEVEQCGNGARCFVRFVHEQGLTNKQEVRVETYGGLITLTQESNGAITVDMGMPRFAPADIPFTSESDSVVQALEVNNKIIDISVVSMGNPHAVQVVTNVETAPVETDGPAIERHVRFPRRVNAGFMEVVDRHHIRLRVYERGAGETLACGTGACAAVVAGIRRGLLTSPVRVSTHGGDLSIAWQGEGQAVMMTGPAVSVFTGEIELPL